MIDSGQAHEPIAALSGDVYASYPCMSYEAGQRWLNYSSTSRVLAPIGPGTVTGTLGANVPTTYPACVAPTAATYNPKLSTARTPPTFRTITAPAPYPAQPPSTTPGGADPTSEATACSYYLGGAYYVRRENGRIDKVSPEEAHTFTTCYGMAAAPDKQRDPTPLTVVTTPVTNATKLSTVRTPSVMQFPTRIATTQPTTPISTVNVGGGGGTFGGAGSTRPLTPLPVVTVPSPTSVPPIVFPPPIVPPPAPSSGSTAPSSGSGSATSSSGGGGGGGGGGSSSSSTTSSPGYYAPPPIVFSPTISVSGSRVAPSQVYVQSPAAPRARRDRADRVRQPAPQRVPWLAIGAVVAAVLLFKPSRRST